MARVKGTHQLEKKSGTAKSRKERRKYSGMSQREYMKTARDANKKMKEAGLSKEDYREKKLKRGDWGYVEIRSGQDDESYDPSHDPTNPFEDGGKIYGYYKGGIIQHD